jgi:hypothetical protein
MAIWRDSLDELIADLEQTVPAATAPSLSAARVVAACTEAAMAARNGSPSMWD